MPREVALTLAGERLARATSEAMRLLRGAIADLTEEGDGVLSITTAESLASQWLAPRLGAFQLAHPKLAVRLDTGPRIADLGREGFDVAIRSGSGAWPGLESLYLFPSNVTPLCTPEVRDALGGLARPERPGERAADRARRGLDRLVRRRRRQSKAGLGGLDG